jgi:hypothetical protein
VGVSVAIVSFAIAADGALTQARHLFFDSDTLGDLIGQVENRRDEPEDVNFGWIESIDYEEGHPFEEDVEADQLWDPAEILTSLAWLATLGARGDVPKFESRGNFTAEEFRREFGSEIDRVRALCSTAAENGERVGVFTVP